MREDGNSITMKELNETVKYLKEHGIEYAEIGIVLGTGLGALLEHVHIIKTIEYSNIPHFPVSTVEFHKGKLIYGEIGKKKVLIMQGRFHLYEGYSMQQITYPIPVMKLLGIKYLFLSNVAGGINPQLKKGDMVIIDDHINLQNGSPLVGKNIDELGPRFPDMCCPYSTALIKILEQNAIVLGIKLKKGIYAAVIGPQLETRAEYRFLWKMGADMVGMSTVPEVIVANHMNIPCGAISIITDECNPDNLEPVNINEIIAIAGKADKALSSLISESIKNL